MTRTATPGFAGFEDELVEGLKAVFEERIAFNRVLGLKITRLDPQLVEGRIASYLSAP